MLNNFVHAEGLLYPFLRYCNGGHCNSQVCCLLERNGKWYKTANMAKITDMVKTATTWFRYYVVWNWGFHQTLLRNLNLRRLVWISDSGYTSGNSPRVFHAVLMYQLWNIRFYLHLAILFCFSPKGRHLGDNSWASLWSDKYLVWSKKHRFVCHL